jgi:hypothetical protein
MNDVLTRPDAVNRRACQQHEPEGSEEQSHAQRWPNAEAQDEPGRQADRHRTHDEVPREERKPDLQRAVGEHELHVERREEEPSEHRGGPENAYDIRDGDIAKTEEAERHER